MGGMVLKIPIGKGLEGIREGVTSGPSSRTWTNLESVHYLPLEGKVDAYIVFAVQQLAPLTVLEHTHRPGAVCKGT